MAGIVLPSAQDHLDYFNAVGDSATVSPIGNTSKTLGAAAGPTETSLD